MTEGATQSLQQEDSPRLILSLEDGVEKLMALCNTLTCEEIDTKDTAGRILGCAFIGPQDYPASDCSVMDGYACAISDNHREEYYSVVVTENGAGQKLAKGTAVAVRTGESLPAGVDIVIPHEKASIVNDVMHLGVAEKKGLNIRRRGEDFLKAELILPAKSLVTPGMVGVMLALGAKRTQVIRQPKVAVVSVGEGIASDYATNSLNMTIDSIGPMLAAMVKRDGGVVISVSSCGHMDTVAKIDYLCQVLIGADVLITIGGTYSNGRSEVFELFHQAGASILFRGLAVKPGGHAGSAFFNGKPLLALSGHASACAVGYQLLVYPALSALGGRPHKGKIVQAECVSDEIISLSCRTFLRGYAFPTDCGWKVKILPGQKSTMKRSLMYWNALLDVGVKEREIYRGMVVSVRLSEWF